MSTSQKLMCANQHGCSSDLNSNVSSFNSEFWDFFIKNNWEKNEFSQNDQLISPPLSEDHLFDILVAMSDEQITAFERYGYICNAVRLYIGDNTRELNSGYFHLYPKKEDVNFRSYYDRVQQNLGEEEFALVVDVITMSPALKAWSKEFLKSMYRPLKAISFGHLWSIFYGNYSTTSYGVHDHNDVVAAESAFYFPITGKKKMLTWHPDYVKQNPELKQSRNYSKHESASTVVSAESRGMMYWPSDRWHIGSSVGGDVSIVLGVRSFTDGYIIFAHAFLDGLFDAYVRSDTLGRYGKKWGKLFFWVRKKWLRFSKKSREKQIRSFPFDPDNIQACTSALPVDVKKVGKPFSFVFGDNFEKVLSLFWLIHLSTLGLDCYEKNLPAFTPSLSLKMRRHLGVILLWRQVDIKTILIVSDMFSCEAPVFLLPIIKIIASTSENEEVVYAELVEKTKEITTEPFEEALSNLVSFLVESRCFYEL